MLNHRCHQFFAYVVCLFILETTSYAQRRSQPQQPVLDDGTPWATVDYSRLLELSPTAPQAPSLSPVKQAKPFPDIRLNPFPPLGPQEPTMLSKMLPDASGDFALMLGSSRWNNQFSIQKCDVAAGSVQPCFTLPKQLTPISLSADGKLMICSPDMYQRADPYLELWSVDGTPHILCRIGSKPGSARLGLRTDNGNRPRFTSAQFIDANRMIGFDAAGFTLLEFQNGEMHAIYHLASDPTGLTCFASPDGRLLVSTYNGKLVVLEASTGNCIRCCTLPSPLKSGPLGISPDGDRLAMGGAAAKVFDLTTGQVIPTAPSIIGFGTPTWIGRKFLFDGNALYDVDSQNYFWRYESRSRFGLVARPGGGVFYTKSAFPTPRSEPIFSLAWMPMPDEPALQADEKLRPSKVLAGPGSKITVQLNMDTMPSDQRAAILSGLTKLLEGNGMSVAAGQEMKLVATVKEIGSGQVVLDDPLPGDPKHLAKITAHQWQCTVSFESRGQSYWETGGRNNGPSISIPTNRSLTDDEVKAFEKKTHPSADLILRGLDHLPAYIYAITDLKKVGVTKIE